MGSAAYLWMLTSRLNRKKHPFFEHSDADFYLAVRDGKVVGRICAGENKLFNEYHKTKKSQFYFFDSENDLEAASALFDAVFDWSKAHGLDTVIGPKGFPHSMDTASWSRASNTAR